MLALWNPARLAATSSYQAWERALLDDQDIARHVATGDLAPINIGGVVGLSPARTTGL